jgi:DNA mismatch endonuclease (patch repair protein)
MKLGSRPGDKLGTTPSGGARMDTISTIRRRANMAAIRSKNTKPEIAVRQFLFRNGLRFRLHAKSLPGKPDIIFPSRRLAVFIHGCFWHGCKKCIDGKRKVKSNSEYWTEKVLGNRHRDRRNKSALREAGWTSLTIWECETHDPNRLRALLNAIRALPKR